VFNGIGPVFEVQCVFDQFGEKFFVGKGIYSTPSGMLCWGGVSSSLPGQ